MGNPPVAPETTALGHPRFGAGPGLPDMRRAHLFHTVRACAANPSTEKGSFRSGPRAPRARPAPVPTSILDIRHHLEQLLIAPSRTPYPRKEAGK